MGRFICDSFNRGWVVCCTRFTLLVSCWERHAPGQRDKGSKSVETCSYTYIGRRGLQRWRTVFCITHT